VGGGAQSDDQFLFTQLKGVIPPDMTDEEAELVCQHRRHTHHPDSLSHVHCTGRGTGDAEHRC
jgi:hypothetical protein